jgi:hypothetical protein
MSQISKAVLGAIAITLRSSGNLAHAAIAPGCAATAGRAADRAPDCTCTDRAGSDRAATAATDRAATAGTGRTATAAAGRTATAAAISYLHAAAYFFLIEEMERGETDVGHFLFA